MHANPGDLDLLHLVVPAMRRLTDGALV